MLRKVPKILLLAGLVVLLALMIGCSTKKPWEPSTQAPLQLILVSGPDTATAVPNGTYASFNWITRGGSERITGYQWYLDPLEDDYNTASLKTTAFYPDLAGADSGLVYTFYARVTDSEGHTATTTRIFTVSDTLAIVPDTTNPIIAIDSSMYWLSGAYVATGSVVSFSWTGNDHKGNNDTLTYQYIFSPTHDTSGWIVASSVTFSQIPAASPAVFKVRAMDPTGNMSDWDTLAFVIRTANVLYIDDYQWLDALGNVDIVKELQQKEFYRATLQGYAFAEWDNDVQGVPAIGDLAGFSVIIWAADSHSGSADPNYRLWTDIGDNNGGALKQFIDGGGKLILTGGQTLNYLFDVNPPASTHFEAAYLGVSDTLIVDVIDTTMEIDTLVVPPDTTYTYDTTFAPTWVASGSADFTEATGSGEPGYPAFMKIDPSKNGSQLDYSASLLVVKSTVTPLFTVGLDVSGGEPDNYGQPCGWLYSPGGTPRSATLAFDTFSMGEGAMQETFRALLTTFGL
jgi:hypothetical protein